MQSQLKRCQYVDPTEVMNKRWFKLISKRIPTVDLIDLSAETFEYRPLKRQFAPEYSSNSYDAFLRDEFAPGDYLATQKSLQVSRTARSQMIMLIEEIGSTRGYTMETQFLAVYLADKYLIFLLNKEKEAPSLILLAAVCVLIAAKLE